MLNFPDAPTIGQVHSAAACLWTWDGVKWKATGGATDESVNVITPADGATVVLADERPVYVNNAVVLNALTFRLPFSGEYIEISFLNPVTVLTIQTSTGVTIPNSPTNAYGPGAALEFKFANPAVGWVYWK